MVTPLSIESERLLLRPFHLDDHIPYSRLNSDPEVLRFINGGVALSPGESWRLMAMQVGHWQLRGFGPWAVELKANGTMIGHLGLWEPEGWPGVELCWRLERAYWGRGLATEGALAVMNYAFSKLGIDRLVSVIHPENQASIRVAEKIGMTPLHEWHTGGYDVVVYGRARDSIGL